MAARRDIYDHAESSSPSSRSRCGPNSNIRILIPAPHRARAGPRLVALHSDESSSASAPY